MMTGCIFGNSDEEVRRKVEDRTKGKSSVEDLKERGLAVGTASEIVDQLGRMADAGIQRVMLQWIDLEDIDGLEVLATGVLPQVN